jgi:hypothetical protein
MMKQFILILFYEFEEVALGDFLTVHNELVENVKKNRPKDSFCDFFIVSA